MIESAQDPKELWPSLNSVKGNGKNISSTRRNVILEPKAVGSKINQFSATIGCGIAKKITICTKGCLEKYESVIQGDGEDQCELQCVSSKAVSKILHSLRVIKAAGLDNIPASEVELSPSTTYLINKSIIHGTVPALWKVTRVTPLYKAEDTLLVEHYRPVSLLPVLSKVLEREVHTQTSAYLDQLGLLYKHQYGFRRGRHTVRAVGHWNNSVLDALDRKTVTGTLFLDISKAFDSINQKILLGKLEHVGLFARSLRWFKSYLSDRRQCVYTNGEVPETLPVNLSVPQGSILIHFYSTCTITACQLP